MTHRCPYCDENGKTADEIINCDAAPFRLNLSTENENYTKDTRK
jgi:hypothetical protein